MTEVKKVKSISKMDNETFLKHMNARHAGAAGIGHYGKSNVPDDESEALLRKMHEVLHRNPANYGNIPPENGSARTFDHEHGKADE